MVASPRYASKESASKEQRAAPAPLCYNGRVFDGRNPTAESNEAITIYGAREHNLKNLSLSIPRNRFVVVTGVSGSGKSTLAFDLLFAEGQRRFPDSIKPYSPPFVPQPFPPDFDLITPLPPTVRNDQRTN